MTISVLMSVYNAEKPERLDRAIRSVWDDQTLKPSQIILIKDGPLSIALDEVINSWQEKLGNTLCVIINDSNLGLTKSLNKGLKVVECEYVARMDSDDIAHPDRFKCQVEFLNYHPEIDVVGGTIQEFNDNNPNIGKRYYPTNPDEIKKYIVRASPLAHPTVMMRNSLFLNGFKYDENYITSQDLALWFDLLAHGHQISNLKDVTLYFRLEDNTFARRSRKKALGEMKIYFRGIKSLYGIFSLNYIYPLMRFVFRMLPQKVVKLLYNSSIRKSVLN